jgi:hypothetical protein
MIIHETKMGIESTSNWLKAAGDLTVSTQMLLRQVLQGLEEVPVVSNPRPELHLHFRSLLS